MAWLSIFNLFLGFIHFLYAFKYCCDSSSLVCTVINYLRKTRDCRSNVIEPLDIRKPDKESM